MLKITIILLASLLSWGAFSHEIDTTLFHKMNQLDSKLVVIEKDGLVARFDINRVDELNRTRFDDLYIWVGIFVALITGGFILITINANNVAKKQAIEELDKLSARIENLENKAISVEAQLNEAETKLNTFESLKKKENE